VLHVWREGEGRDCQLKARLVAQVRAGAAGPEHVDRQYALGIDGVLARIRAWLVAFSSDQ